MFGFLLGFPIVYFYRSPEKVDLQILKNFRLNLGGNLEILSFSAPFDKKIDEKQLDEFVDRWFFELKERFSSSEIFSSVSLEKTIRNESIWSF